MPHQLDQPAVVGDEAAGFEIRPLEVVDADGENHEVRLHELEVAGEILALEEGGRGGAVDANLADCQSVGGVVQVESLEGEPTRKSHEADPEIVDVARQVEVPALVHLPAAEGVAPGEDDGLQVAVPQDVDAAESEAQVPHLPLLRDQVQGHRRGGVGRRHGHAADAHHRLRLQAAAAGPGARIGALVAHRGVRTRRGVGEHEAAAAVHPVAQGHQVLAEGVRPGAALDVGPTDVQDADVPASGEDEGVQLPQEGVEIGRGAARELEGVPLDAGIGHRRNPAMEAALGARGEEGDGEGREEDQSFHLPILCWTAADGRVFRRS